MQFIDFHSCLPSLTDFLYFWCINMVVSAIKAGLFKQFLGFVCKFYLKALFNIAISSLEK
jgi:hypothetical protein